MNSGDDEIKVSLTADYAQLQAGMEAGAATVAESSEAITAAVQKASTATVQAQGDMTAAIATEAEAFNAAVQSKINAMTRLNAAFAGGVTDAASLAEAEAALDEAMATGAISASGYAGYVARLDEVELALTGSTEAATAAIDENTAAMALNGGVARELGVMIGELVRGNYTRLEGSATTLANRTGILSTVLTALMTPIGLVTIGAGAAGLAIFEAAEDFSKMEGAVLSTGSASGYTAGQLIEMANAIGAQGERISVAREALMALAQSGKFAGEDLRIAAQAAVDMADLTGQSVQQTAGMIEKLREDPLKAVVALNDQFHFLTVAEFETMQQMVATGDKIDAARIGIDAMADTMHARTLTMQQDANVIVKAWRAVANEYTTTMQEADVALGGGDTAEKLAVAKGRMAELTTEAERYKSALPTYGLGMLAAHNAKVEEAVVNQLQAQVDEQTEKVKTAAAEAQQTANTIDAMGKKKTGGTGDLEKELHDQEAEQQVSYDKRAQFEMEYWGQVLQTSKQGTEQYAAAWEKVQVLQKQMDEQQLSSWKRTQEASTEASRKAAEEQSKLNAQTMSGLAMVRAGTEANTAQRLQADADVLASATKLYGAESSQQKSALTQMLADSRSYDAEVVRQQQQTAQETAQIDISSAKLALAIKQDQIQTAFALSDGSRKQELAAMQAANEAEYQLEMQAFARELALLDAKSAAAAAVEKQIEAAQKQYTLATVKNTDDQVKAIQQSWQKALKPIDSAFQQSINGMIQGTQSLKQGLDKILLSIVESYAQMGLKTVMDWIANEGAKTAATTAGITQRGISEATGAAESKAIDASTGKSQITSAAATGAAKAYQAIVGIPYVGPILAPIAAGVAFAGIEAFSGMLSSAEGGWERVPFDGALTELHKDEMVLPAHVANPIRDMAKNGGGQGGGSSPHYHFNFSGIDGPSMKQYIRKHSGEIAQAVAGKTRNASALRN